ncbi:MAG: pantoate--beta-alanine ligase [Candidatus Cloacimonetes bacterium]|nr:pantoate--beta-alanine ligase [Candidatus Cloacimonadota bacterium]
MQVIKTISQMKVLIKSLQNNSKIGFVPTMGYLHQGHLSLVKKSLKECDVTVVSIYVNPLQFGVNEDFDKYPRNLINDLYLLQETLKKENKSYQDNQPTELSTKQISKIIVFCPDNSEIFPKDFNSFVEIGILSDLYCGKTRPGHFRGVATIILKLLNIVQPNLMYMGEKDFQQVFILEKMIKDLNFSSKIVRCPIIRESDGLAMSSRNVYLKHEPIEKRAFDKNGFSERKRAICLYKSLLIAKNFYYEKVYEVEFIKKYMKELIIENNGEIDYIAFINDKTFQEVEYIDEDTRILLAVKIGKTRLIDNIKMVSS